MRAPTLSNLPVITAARPGIVILTMLMMASGCNNDASKENVAEKTTTVVEDQAAATPVAETAEEATTEMPADVATDVSTDAAELSQDENSEPAEEVSEALSNADATLAETEAEPRDTEAEPRDTEAEPRDTEAEPREPAAAPAMTAAASGLDRARYRVLDNAINNNGDKIVVHELFWFRCGHCYQLEPRINAWGRQIAEDVHFEQVPAVFSTGDELHGKAFYTMQSLGILDRAKGALFKRLHVERKQVNSLNALTKFLTEFGVSEAEITDRFNSFEVDMKLRRAKKITRKSGIRGVPALIVGGKYQTGAQLAGGEAEIFEVVDKLIEKIRADQ